MDLATAIRTVETDIRQSYPTLSLPLAIKLAREVTSTVGLNPDDEPTYTAYRVLMAASEAEVILALAKLLELTLDHGDVWESTDGYATIDGMDPYEWLTLM